MNLFLFVSIKSFHISFSLLAIQYYNKYYFLVNNNIGLNFTTFNLTEVNLWKQKMNSIFNINLFVIFYLFFVLLEFFF